MLVCFAVPTRAGLGASAGGASPFEVGAFSQAVRIVLRVEATKHALAAIWLRRLLYKGQVHILHITISSNPFLTDYTREWNHSVSVY